MEKEIWKDIKGFEGIYQVSSMGRVKSLPKIKKCFGKDYLTKEKIIKPYINTYGYQSVGLIRNKKVKRCVIHRLVALNFIPNLNSKIKTQVNHINEIKTDNRVVNLEWVTAKENINHGTARERIIKSQQKIRTKAVLQYDLNLKLIKRWRSTRSAERSGYHSGHIIECCKGKRKTHKKYIWKYE